MTVYNKMGMTKDGILTAVESRVIGQGGAYTAIGPLTMFLTGYGTPAPYKLPNYKYDAWRVFTNNPVSAAMRGHGFTHTRFACDTQMSMMAEELGIDPVEIKMRNAIDNPKRGEVYRAVNGFKLKTCGIKEALKAATEDSLWADREKMVKQDGPISYGTGISGTAYHGGARQLGHQACAAFVRICEDGTVNLITGATDCGQGSDTVLSMMAAEELGVRYEDVSIKRVDTAYTPVDPGSYGSRVTLLAGQATQLAARDAKEQLLAAAAKAWGVKPDDIEIRDAVVTLRTDPKRRMSFEKLAKIACYDGAGAVILGRGHSDYGVDEPLDFNNGTGEGGINFSFTAQTVRLGVDLETGKVDVNNFTIAHDCGFPLHPVSVEGQNEGGAVQGLGQAIYEGFIMENGKTYNSTLLDYKMPRSTDAPDIRVIDIITNDPDGPYGAKEASEGSHVSTPPAVIDALHDATGVWFKELPVTPEKIVKGLKEAGKWGK